MRLALSLLLLPLLLATGCPPSANKAEPAPAPCNKFGEQCQFAPGKLGSCVDRSNCPTGESCLVCQSQH